MPKVVNRKALYVGNLSISCTEQELGEVFSKFGEVIDTHIHRPEDSTKTLTYGFVNFVSIKSAIAAKKELDGTKFQNEEIW